MAKFVITFFTHSGAMYYKRTLERSSIEIQMMPVPRKLSSDCGIALVFESDNDHEAFISDEVEAIYMLNNNQYVNLYRSNG